MSEGEVAVANTAATPTEARQETLEERVGALVKTTLGKWIGYQTALAHQLGGEQTKEKDQWWV